MISLSATTAAPPVWFIKLNCSTNQSVWIRYRVCSRRAKSGHMRQKYFSKDVQCQNHQRKTSLRGGLCTILQSAIHGIYCCAWSSRMFIQQWRYSVTNRHCLMHQARPHVARLAMWIWFVKCIKCAHVRSNTKLTVVAHLDSAPKAVHTRLYLGLETCFMRESLSLRLTIVCMPDPYWKLLFIKKYLI